MSNHLNHSVQLFSSLLQSVHSCDALIPPLLLAPSANPDYLSALFESDSMPQISSLAEDYQLENTQSSEITEHNPKSATVCHSMIEQACASTPFTEPEKASEAWLSLDQTPTSFAFTTACSPTKPLGLEAGAEVSTSFISASYLASSLVLPPPILKPRKIKRRLQQQGIASLSIFEAASLQCSICGCLFVRRYDLRRHHRGHNPISAAQKRYVCNGVRIDRAEEYMVTYTADAKTFEGELRVGSYCSREFSRKDSLLRHLKKHKCLCVCDVLPAAHYTESLGKAL